MSRKTMLAIIAGLGAILIAMIVISIVTGEAAYILWSALPLLVVMFFLYAAVRGQTLGERKFERDDRIAAKKAAERQARSITRSHD